MSIDPSPTEPLIAFLDANIVLEGKPMADLPWEEVATDGTIRLLIVPKAMEEIDAKKRDGRLDERYVRFAVHLTILRSHLRRKATLHKSLSYSPRSRIFQLPHWTTREAIP